MQILEKFHALGLSDETLKALQAKGFEEPTPIQEQTIPLLLKGERDIIGQAQTGTGKTAAFGLPIIERISSQGKHVKAIVVAPTRELAIQVSEEMATFKGNKSLRILPIYGGASIEQQIRKLRSGVDVVVGTPGRIIDLINRRVLNLDQIEFAVLDEADEMLNMGFVEDIEKILEATPEDRRMLLFSATMPQEIMRISKRFMKEYDIVKVKKQQLTTNLTDQIYFEVRRSDKFEALSRIIDIETEFYGIVFCRTKVDVDTVTSKLNDRGYDSEALHGDISQHQRERILKKFKSKRINVLVATDVAARGLDINDLTHVINYSIPQDPESYVHRIGRTGRAGKEGTAITFVTPEEYRKLVYIQRVAKTDIRKEQIPAADEIIHIKRERILENIQSSITDGRYDSYKDMTDKLLENNDAASIISALLKSNYADELEQKNYGKIRDVAINKSGKTRLFIALGKKDKVTPKTIVEMIRKEVKIDNNKIKDIRIFENFSFVTLPFEEAEIVLQKLGKRNRGKKPMVERAKEKKGKR